MSSFIFPFDVLLAEQRELGLVVAVLIGFGFGFVLERAGFGRSTKLAAQFYFTDLTVFKVMFGAIVTAMLGIVLAAGVGLVDLKAISDSAVSGTFLWPMLVGGLLLGVGFVISGYCPGTSIVGAASGHIDAILTFAGVILGSLLFGEVHALWPALQKFHVSSDLGPFYLYDWLGVPAPVLAAVVTAAALAAFLGADKVERLMARRRAARATEGAETAAAAADASEGVAPRRPRRLVFAVLAGSALLVLATLSLPLAPRAAPSVTAVVLDQATLARRVLDEPWTLRILDLRPQPECVKARIPGAECTPEKTLAGLGLAFAPGYRDLVLVGAGGLKQAPPASRGYRGKLFLLDGGWAGWQAYALTKPPPPAPGASPAVLATYKFRSALHTAMTGAKPPPPPAAGTVKFAPGPKKKGGGCG